MMQKKLLQINTLVNSGSTGRIAEDIGLACIRKGWKSYIAFGRNERPSQSVLLQVGTKMDFNLHALKTRLSDRHGFGSKNATFALIEQIKRINPDIIHLHNVHGYYLNIEVLFNYLAGTDIPVVWTLHDCWTFTGHCYHFEIVGCDKWKTGCFDCPQKRIYPASLFVDNSKKNYNDKQALFNSVKNLTIVPVSEWLNKLVGQSFLKDHSRHLIYNGINLNEFYPQKNSAEVRDSLGIGKKFLVLGVASNWKARKGYEDFIKLSKLTDESIVYVMVGVDKKEQKELPSNIIGIARTESVAQLAGLYSAADLFLNLTYEDNFPSTNLESLACGTPLLTYNTGGSPESVSEKTGFIVEQGDLKSVLDAIFKVKMNGKAYYSDLCRATAERLYNKDDRFNEYIMLYDRILS